MVPAGVWKYTRGWGLVSGLVTAAMLEHNPPAEVVKCKKSEGRLKKTEGRGVEKTSLIPSLNKMMNELEEATRSNLVLLSSGFAHGGGDRLWPGRFHETKRTDGNGGTVCNRLTGLFPARKLCLR